IATGSEVHVAVDAAKQLEGQGTNARVVSMPCWELFEAETSEYRDEVLPPAVTARVAIEEASTLGWERYVGSDGAIIGMRTFGQSAPFKDVEAEFGFTPDEVAKVVREVAGQATVNSSTT
ncbi:MAG TPA: transketolase C-terminal domain-containing protein, partial [Solirubrobacterales bacterium]|nr:transketolase C-terminal domain-containing protein [Solirubrobacterales bacterium]